MNRILSRLAEQAGARAGDVTVSDVRIGLGYTAVQLGSGAAGVAYTFRQDLPTGCTVFRGTRPLAGKKASDILPYLESTDKVEVAVGLATANALTNHGLGDAVTGDVLDALDLRPDDDVAMIGHFDPLVPPLKQRVRALRIFELAPGEKDILPAEAAGEWLPRSQVALITSTSLINGTLEGLLESARGCRQVALVGASTPLLATVFAGTPVTHLSGVEVTDPEGILTVVSEGGGMRFFKGHVRKVVVPVTPGDS